MLDPKVVAEPENAPSRQDLAKADIERHAERERGIAAAAVPLCPTPETALEGVRADLALSVHDLYLTHASDGYEELDRKLRAIAIRAQRAIHLLGELHEQGDFDRLEMSR